VNYEDGERTGEYKRYHENGNISISGQYKEDKKVGHWHTYLLWNGGIGEEMNYEDNKLTGEYKSYDEKGNIRESGQYKDDVRVGHWIAEEIRGTRGFVTEKDY
jgi:antitoxin component YwqK of YwqJK toxin-antitoxin module